MNLSLVKNALVILLLMVATVSQPLLAIPASCQMPGQCPAVTCAGCCAENPCCASSDQRQSSPLAAVAKFTADFLPALTWHPVEAPMPVVQQTQFPQFTRAFGDAHAPPPLALNCIHLI